jgi:uncharacterized protein (DUF2141 family)
MKKTILISMIAFCNFMFSQNVSLTVDVSGFKNNNGKVLIGVYNSDANFLKKIFIGKSVSIENKKAQVVFENVPAGTYAVSVYHDINDNNKLDSNFLGIPKEPYASSNDAKGFIGPPKYSDAKFELKTNKIISIKL